MACNCDFTSLLNIGFTCLFIRLAKGGVTSESKKFMKYFLIVFAYTHASNLIFAIVLKKVVS